MTRRGLPLTLIALMVSFGFAKPMLAQKLTPLSPQGELLPSVTAIKETPQPEWAEVQKRESLLDSASRTDEVLEIVVGRGRLLTLKHPLAEPDQPAPVIAIGDPTVIDFEVLGAQQIRLTGQRIGVTDLSIITSSDEPFTIEVHVVVDLAFLRARLRQLFPDASLRLSHLRQHVVVEGQARDAQQVARIIETIQVYLTTVQPSTTGGAAVGSAVAPGEPPLPGPGEVAPPTLEIIPEPGRPPAAVTNQEPEVINMLEIPGPQQVLLKVQIAELNRTAMRELGASFLIQDGQTAIGTNVSGGLPATRLSSDGGLMGLLDPVAVGTSAFAIFDQGQVNFFVDALQRNQVYKTLAEPTLVAMHGQEASFLAGGEFPVPVPQGGAATGAITVQYREYGVSLNFVPFILDGDTVRLAVAPEVSSIDFSLGIVQAGIQVPALNTRKTQTVVELQQGQTLAISGLLQVELDGRSDRIPGMGDLPYIGPFFRNNSMRRVEKELIVLVTPYLVAPLDAHQVAALPGAEVHEPDDHELYFEGNLESRSGRGYRSTTGETYSVEGEGSACIEREYLFGPSGYSP